MKSESLGIFLNLNLSLPTSEWTENREWGSDERKRDEKGMMRDHYEDRWS